MPILKEEVARTKWCPYSRVIGAGGAYNRDTDDAVHGHCVTTDCMAWRTVANAMDDDVKGYCGAFGKPANA